MLKLSDFDYDLPKELIAQHPLKIRDAARLLVINRQKQSIEHRIFKDVIEYLEPKDLLVLNDTRVLPSRLLGRRNTGGKAEILILARKEGMTFRALIRPARLKLGEKINFDNGNIWARITGKNEVTFSARDVDEIYSYGVMPLPPYIKRPAQEEDRLDYQTVYAREDGSIASPTAGLHFTPQLLSAIKSKGINIVYVTLHISYSTFRPVKVDDITQHKMEPEQFLIPQGAVRLIKDTCASGGRIIAGGTTALRSLETYAAGRQQGYTDLFIWPGYKFRLVDCLLTNFHLPRTTLFILACAFAGEKLLKKAYQEAVAKKYRFYSYGDAMLIL